MFTGIVTELGTVEKIITNNSSMRLTIKADKVLNNVKFGDSIAVNGVCLTVTCFSNNTFEVDIMPETFNTTSLSSLITNSPVNLESSLQFGGKIGGHFVSGHIDGTATIRQIETTDNAINYYLKLDSYLLKYCVLHGSIAVDGTSLTIFAVDDIGIKIALIPHTVKYSVIGMKKAGDIVNIECDMLVKYVEKMTCNLIR